MSARAATAVRRTGYKGKPDGNGQPLCCVLYIKELIIMSNFRSPIGLDCCGSQPPFTPEKRICFAPGTDRPRFFRQECRDCFWPDFTHPTWLCCDTLYGCCRERCRR